MRLEVIGMTCAMCAKTVERVLCDSPSVFVIGRLCCLQNRARPISPKQLDRWRL